MVTDAPSAENFTNILEDYDAMNKNVVKLNDLLAISVPTGLTERKI